MTSLLASFIFITAGPVHMCQVCEPRIDKMSDPLLLRPVFGCIPIADRPKLHKIFFLLSVVALWCGSQTIHISGIYFVQHFFRRLRSAVMAFVRNDHSIIFYQLMNLALFAQ